MMNYLNQSSLFRIISYQIQLTSEKSNSFSKALTIIYTLQTSIDFEKDLSITKHYSRFMNLLDCSYK